MSWWHRLLRRAAMEEQLDRELRYHLDRHTADLVAQGRDPVQARRLARIAIGGEEQVKEQCRDARGTGWLLDLWQDCRFALRMLRDKPAFTTVSVLTLALGIGAATAIFSAVDPILFEPLPYPQAARIATIWYASPDGSRANQAFGTYRELAARSRLFDSFAVFKPWQPTLIGSAEPERFDGQRVSAAYFRVLGVAPALGHEFDPADDRRNGPNVVILSDAVWRRRFNSDRTIVGRQIPLNDNLYRVIGVMPGSFENVLAPSAAIWSLLQYDTSLPREGREWGHHLRLIGRVRPGISTEQARGELDQIAHSRIPEFSRAPWADMRLGLIVNSLQDDVTRGVRPALLAVLAAVLLVLAIACVNVTNLLLARSARRRPEFAMRAALGAGRMRLVRQLLAESLLLTTMGGLLGMGVAEIGVRALVALSPPDLPRAAAIHVALPVFAFGLGVTMLIGLAVGLAPALEVSRGRLNLGLRQGSRRSTRGRQRTRRSLVVVEVALALVLLVGAGLLLRSLQRLFGVAPGFNPSHLLTMQVQIASTHRYPDDAAFHRYYAQALDAVRSVPGVASAAFTSQLPLNGEFAATFLGGTEVYGGTFEHDNDRSDSNLAFRAAVTPGYFETMGIPLIRGRWFDARDMAPGAVRPVLINQSFARRKFPFSDPIGQRCRFGGFSTRPWDVIVGVVGDVNQVSLALGQTDTLYVATAQWLWADNPLWLVVRSPGEPAALAPAIKQAIWSVDKDQPIVRVATMDSLVASSAAQRRFALVLFEAFALAALALAAIGIFGVLSGSVAERMREIGVRAALGASRGDILALVIRQGMTLTAIGAALGLGAATAASHAIVTLLFGVSRLDPPTYLAVIALLAGVSAIACWIPAWRAARVDPALTLRAE